MNLFFLKKMFGPILGLIGFTASGITKGSLAALIQSWYGLVPKGSFFAKLTSTAMSV